MFDAKRKMRLCRLLMVLLTLALAVSVYYAFALVISRQCQLHEWPNQDTLPGGSSFHASHDVFHSVADRVSVINTVLRSGSQASLSRSGTSPSSPSRVVYFAGSPSASAKTIAKIPPGYQRAVTEREALVFLDLLLTLDRLTRRHNITCFMNYGTLLGSFRHHAMIPWDDDADVAMPYADKASYTSSSCI